MKKKTIQLNRKLVLQKENIVLLTDGQQNGMLGGVTNNGCVIVTIAVNCATRVCTGASVCLTACPTQDIQACVSYRITPGCN